MRSVSTSVLIECDIEAAWDRLSRPSFCAALISHLRLKRLPLCRLRPPRDNAEPLLAGDNIDICTPAGKRIETLRVEGLRNNSQIDFLNVDVENEPRREAIVKFSVSLEDYGKGRTKVKATYVSIMTNNFLEFLTLVTPFNRALHAFLIRRALRTLKDG